ncbi:MAG: 2-oxoacid:acceptor oxidoreductase subunit alpha [Deltaproteobacteria bacterium]|nr:2-oxoacid:acceptor oxidoreductase subunit alpha [Deltaproteobacteria bacterium]
MESKKVLHMSLVGSGGDGVMATANMILKTAAKMGFYGMMAQSYGPQIRGGESAAHVSIGAEPVRVTNPKKDLVICFRFADVTRFAKELSVGPGACVLHGKEEGELPSILKSEGGVTLPIPFQEILEKEGLPEIAKNVLVFGMFLHLLGWELKHGSACIREVFGHKSSAVISSNLKAMEVGFSSLESVTLPFQCPKPQKAVERKLFSGNEACARGAVDAGCRFFAGYPITPSSEILEEIYDLLPKVGGKLIQGEDEIASLGMVVGASYGGVPAMTATSGPGLSLMTEMLGLSSIAEIPVVIVDCQRAGPSTGIPSRTEQSDLWHALYGGHGDFPRVVLAPTDVKDCFQTMHRAFYLSETYQIPVLVLSDALIAQRLEIMDPVDASGFPHGKRLLAKPPFENYQRFDLQIGYAGGSGTGVNPVAIPGTPEGMHSIAGIEHTEKGTPSSDGDQHQIMNQKRFLKLKTIAKETAPWYSIQGSAKADHALITWGSCAGVAEEYLLHHPETALFVPQILEPFPVEGLQKFLKDKKSVTVLEMNHQGQFYHHLRALGLLDEGKSAVSARRSGGLPFKVEDLEQMMKKTMDYEKDNGPWTIYHGL